MITYTSLQAAVAAISTSVKSVLVSGSETLSANLTIPSTLEVTLAKGAIITLDNYDLTINGPFNGSISQHFSCSGTGVVTFGTGAVKEIYPEWWGTNTTPGTTDMTAAVNACIASSLTGNSLIEASSHYLITSTISIPKTTTGVFTIDGCGSGIFQFEPTATDILFDVVAPSSGIAAFVNLRNFKIYSTDTDYVKTAIKMTDTTGCLVENVIIGATTYWTDTSGGSIGIHTKGRDTLTVRKNTIYADKPIYLGKNPNDAKLQVDVMLFDDNLLAALDDDNSVITCEDGLTFSNLTIQNGVWLGGTNGFNYNNTENTGETSSFLNIRNIRWEQTKADGAGYMVVVEDNSTNPYIASVVLESIEVVGDKNAVPLYSANGVSARKVSTLTMLNCSFPTNVAARTPISLDTCLSARIINQGLAADETVSLTSMVTAREILLDTNLGIVDGIYMNAMPSGLLMKNAPPYVQGAGSPSGVLTPNYVGEDYLDTGTGAWYKSYGLANTNWNKLTN